MSIPAPLHVIGGAAIVLAALAGDATAQAARSGSARQAPSNAPAVQARKPPRSPAAPLPRAMMEALATQVMLDRAGFSPGEIDARPGPNTQRAFEAWQVAQGQGGAVGTSGVAPAPPPPAPGAAPGDPAPPPPPPAPAPSPRPASPGQPAAVEGEPGAAVPAPGAGDVEPLTEYVVTEADVAGPFLEKLPEDLVEQSSLEALSYTSPVELLAERFHVSPALLKRLNPKARYVAGDRLLVPNVEPLTELPKHGRREVPRNGQSPAAANLVVRVSESARSLTVSDASGRVVMYAPVTVGSEHDPLPVGEWKVTDIYDLPVFHYNPELFWDADPSHAKAVIKPGPNNPVGTVWIDLDKEHYGFHGTPEPSRVGHTQSHGCIRLTNWDVVRLAALVRPGTRVLLEK